MSKSVQHILRHRELDLIEDGVLTVAAYPNFYPICYKRGKVLKGLDVDVMRGFAKDAGLKVNFVEVENFDGIWTMPPKDEADVSIGGIGTSDERTLAKTAWTIPYFYVRRTFVFNNDDPIHNIKDIHATVRGTVGTTGWLDAKEKLKGPIGKKYLKPGKTDDEDMRDLAAGKIQGLVRGSFVGEAIVKKDPDTYGMMRPWDINSDLVSSDGECFAYPCNIKSGLAVSLSCYLTHMMDEGTLADLLKKHDLV